MIKKNRQKIKKKGNAIKAKDYYDTKYNNQKHTKQ